MGQAGSLRLYIGRGFVIERIKILYMDNSNNKKFKVYHGDEPKDFLDRIDRSLESYGLKIKQVDKSDFYVEYEIVILK